MVKGFLIKKPLFKSVKSGQFTKPHKNQYKEGKMAVMNRKHKDCNRMFIIIIKIKIEVIQKGKVIK